MPELEKPIVRACDWLIQQSAQGRMPLPKDLTLWSLGERGIISEAIHLYALPAIQQAGEVLNRKYFIDFVCQSKNYYLKNCALTDFTQPNMLLHYYMYIQEALCELDATELAKKGMDVISSYERDDGSLPAYSDVSWICSPGQAQAAVVWFRLGEIESGNRALQYVKKLMNPSGGFFGSYGTGADYLPNKEISWTAKFFLDASNWQIQKHFDTDSDNLPYKVSRVDGRLEALLHATGPLNDKNVLDVGCGKGRFLKIIKRIFPRAKLTGLDISEAMLKYIPKSISTIQGSILDMPLQDATFDIVYCVEALEHAVAIKQAVAEMCRVLKPGGTIVIIDKNAQELGRVVIPSWEQWFLPDELAEILRAYCTDVSWKSIAYTYNKSVSTDGWFLIWRGLKPWKEKVKDIPPTNDATHSPKDSCRGNNQETLTVFQERITRLITCLKERIDFLQHEFHRSGVSSQKISTRIFRFLFSRYPFLKIDLLLPQPNKRLLQTNQNGSRQPLSSDSGDTVRKPRGKQVNVGH